MAKTITIFTPTFNRAHTIGRTFESLCRQTCMDFEWLIIDDGSTDNTEEIVNKWITNSPFKIRYIRQENQGMHGAHNTAYRNIETELNTCIDSDDWMPENGVELIVNFWKKHGSSKYAGILGLDTTVNGRIIGQPFPDKLKETTLSGYYASGGSGDKKIVYRTDVLRNYPEYPLFEGEKYVGLAYKYMLIDQDYKLLTLNKPLVIVEYQQDGSSFNMYSQYWKNPKGFAFYRKTEMVLAPTVKRRFISCVHYVAHCLTAKDKKLIFKSPRPILCSLALIPGFAWYLVIKHKAKTNQKLKTLPK